MSNCLFGIRKFYDYLGVGDDWTTLGTISLDIHLVQIGEANRLHEGYSSYYRRNEAVPLSSATPFSSTEVTSLRKIATFIFKYRPLALLQYHSIVPVSGSTSLGAVAQRSGDKRPAPEEDFDEYPCADSDDDRQPELSTTLVFSDSDSSQVFALDYTLPYCADGLLTRTSPSGFDQKDYSGFLLISVSRRCTGHHPQKELKFEFFSHQKLGVLPCIICDTSILCQLHFVNCYLKRTDNISEIAIPSSFVVLISSLYDCRCLPN